MSRRIETRRGALSATLASLVLLGALLAPEAAAWADDFQGPYDINNWSTTGITGGSTFVAAPTYQQAVFSYAVDLGSGGVTHRTATFSTTADADGLISVDWTYELMHAWFMPEAELTFFAFDANDVRQDVVAFAQATSGSETHSGSIVDMPIVPAHHAP